MGLLVWIYGEYVYQNDVSRLLDSEYDVSRLLNDLPKSQTFPKVGYTICTYVYVLSIYTHMY